MHTHTPSHSRADYERRIGFYAAAGIMEVDFSNLAFHHARDVDDCYDTIEDLVDTTGRKWYFLVNYDGCRIMLGAWVQYAARGKKLNQRWSLGSVQFGPGSETETDIRLRAETGGFRPNIRNTREEALERIQKLKRGDS